MIFFLFVVLESNAQVKLSDRKTTAYKESKKNKNKKHRRQRQVYEKSSKRNQTQSQVDLVPEALKQKYLPKDQNAEKNPSRVYALSERKQKRTMVKKAGEAQRQGMNLGIRAQDQQRRAVKQSKTISKHQGDIPVIPYVLKEREGYMPQPPVDQNPSRTNIKLRNEKLAGYANKSDEAQLQGLVSGKSRIGQNMADKKKSRKTGLVQGNIVQNRSEKDFMYMAKSVEGQNQGMSKGLSKDANRQVMQSASLSRSQFQGDVKVNTRRKEAALSKSAGKNTKAGLSRDLTPQERDAGYMAKSVEGLNQGMAKGANRNKQQIQYFEKSVDAQDQGMFKTRTRAQMNAMLQKNSNSVALDQGTVKGKSKIEKNQELQSSSLTQSQYQGALKGKSVSATKNRADKKSGQMQKAGLISGLTVKQKEAGYMAMSVDGLNQGMKKGASARSVKSAYAGKSKESLDQGLIKGKSQVAKEQELFSNSLTQSQYQGDVRQATRKNQESNYVKKSGESQKAGMISGLTVQQKEAGYMAKAVEGLNQGLSERSTRIKKESTYIRKSRESLDQGLVKGKSSIEKQQELMTNSLTQSQYQGDFNGKTKKNLESGYIRKSNQAQKSGMISALTVQQKEAGYMAKSVEGLSQGMDLRSSRRDMESVYIRKSQEARDQGMIRGKSQLEKNQELMTNSLTQSQFQGDLTGRSRKDMESLYIRKSNQSKKAGLISALTVQEKEAAYMAKSVEGLNQGLVLRSTRRNMESVYIRKSQEALDQGMIRGKTQLEKSQELMTNSLTQSQFQGNLTVGARKDTESKYVRKSQEAQDQGLIKGKSQKGMEQELMSNSLVQSQFQGDVSGKARKAKESGYIGKSKEALDQGLVKGKSQKGRDREIKGNSIAQSLFQGDVRLLSRTNLTSTYIRKSIEAQRVGLEKGIGPQEREIAYMAKSVEGLNQGLVKVNLRDRESLFIKKSIEIQQAGLIKGKSAAEMENQLKQKSGKTSGYRGDERSFTATIAFVQDWSDRRSQAKNLQLSGDFKLRNQLFDKIYNLRVSSRQAKFDGMKEETNVDRWWASIFKKPIDQRKAPAPLRKPRYDPKEHEIWNY